MSTDRIRELLQLMAENELVELELEEGEFKVRLCKQSQQYVQAMPMPAATGAPAPAAASAESPAPVDGEMIESPIVGTFYRSPAPDADPFVKVGDTVNEDTVVCIVEAMKVMNEVKAGRGGVIADILVENGEAVEFGQPLFVVRPGG